MYLAEGQTNSVELNMFILKNTSFVCVLLVCLQFTLKLGCLGRFWKSSCQSLESNRDAFLFHVWFHVFFFNGLIGRMIGI